MHNSNQNQSNKLIITDWNQKRLLFLLNQNRLLSVLPFDLNKTSLLNNIYIGKIQTLSADMQAAFVEIQKGMFGFLPLNDCRVYYPNPKAGDEIVVQVCKEAVKTKLPALTTKLSLAGVYCAVSKPAGSPQIHYSSKLSKQAVQRIENVLTENKIADNLSVDLIVRTASEKLLSEAITASLCKEYEMLSGQLQEFLHKSGTRTCFSCLKDGTDTAPVWVQEIKSLPPAGYDEIITDSHDAYVQLQNTVFFTENQIKIRLYEDASYPLKTLYGLSAKLETALNRRIWLKSGAYLIIEPTEAMTVIDVNTGKYEAKKQMPQPFLTVNKEAAVEIALQLKLRNLSGIILVDFINMDSKEEQQDLLQFMRSLTEQDSVRTKAVDITPLGLMEITRKKVRRPLKEELGEQCQWN